MKRNVVERKDILDAILDGKFIRLSHIHRWRRLTNYEEWRDEDGHLLNPISISDLRATWEVNWEVNPEEKWRLKTNALVGLAYGEIIIKSCNGEYISSKGYLIPENIFKGMPDWFEKVAETLVKKEEDIVVYGVCGREGASDIFREKPKSQSCNPKWVSSGKKNLFPKNNPQKFKLVPITD